MRQHRDRLVILIATGDNPERMRSQAAFASLRGVAQISPSSGKVIRHRLSRGGDREVYRALRAPSTSAASRSWA